MPVQKANTQRYTTSPGHASQLLDPSSTFTYQAPPGSSAGKNSEIEEETKDARLKNSESSNNEELFKHLSYLS